MNKICKKIISVFLSVIMFVSCVPMLQFTGADVFTVQAAAEKITNGNKVGVLNNFTTGWNG